LRTSTRDLIRQHWDSEPCGTRNIPYPIGSFAYYEAIADRRNRLEPYIEKYAQFDKWKGKKVLEVGCGVGSDLLRFAQAGADVTGIDLSSVSVSLAKERLKLYKCAGTVTQADGENIPFKDNTFAYAYNWGVIHHSAHPKKVVNEIYRVLEHGGRFCSMLYHKPSLVTLQMWLAFGLMKGNLESVDSILAKYHESEGTRAYTVKEAKELFSMFSNLKVETRITSYDLRWYVDKYLPLWMGSIIPKSLGWNIIVRGVKV
jgi:ubiquinone/menaquinone biosynthesis C-methylase UbiE